MEARAGELARKLVEQHGDDVDTRWQVAAALIHRAVHVAADGKVEYCKIATYLAEMVGHAHKLMHQEGAKDPHRDVIH